jgi:hypothetical protein
VEVRRLPVGEHGALAAGQDRRQELPAPGELLARHEAVDGTVDAMEALGGGPLLHRARRESELHQVREVEDHVLLAGQICDLGV